MHFAVIQCWNVLPALLIWEDPDMRCIIIYSSFNWPFPSCVKPLFQGETQCEKMQSNLYTTVTLGKWQCDHFTQGDRYIQVNFAENIGQLIFGKLSGDRNIPGDRYIQSRYIQVWLFFIHKQITLISTKKVLHLASFWKEEFLKLGDGLFSFVLLRFRWVVCRGRRSPLSSSL